MRSGHFRVVLVADVKQLCPVYLSIITDHCSLCFHLAGCSILNKASMALLALIISHGIKRRKFSWRLCSARSTKVRWTIGWLERLRVGPASAVAMVVCAEDSQPIIQGPELK
jgi:hypothetical protein